MGYVLGVAPKLAIMVAIRLTVHLVCLRVMTLIPMVWMTIVMAE